MRPRGARRSAALGAAVSLAVCAAGAAGGAQGAPPVAPPSQATGPAPAAKQALPPIALVARAESLLARGRVQDAEVWFYAAAARDPRDPLARAALGRYVASRGAFLAGATLLEEARAFGLDSSVAARALAPVYAAARAWDQLAALVPPVLGPGEHDRVRVLAGRPTAVEGPDSTTFAYQPLAVGAIGRVTVRVGRDSLVADLDASIDGVVVGDVARFGALAQVFAAARPGEALPALLAELRIGEFTLRQVPVQVDRALGPVRARIGLLTLGAYAPTVDAGARVITLRRDGRIGDAVPGRRVPVRFVFPGVRVARAERWVPLESPAGRALLAEARWTLDVRRGELVLEDGR